MNLIAVVLFCASAAVTSDAFAHAGDDGKSNDNIFALVASLIVSANMTDVPADLAKVPTDQLLGCVPKEKQMAMRQLCAGDQTKPHLAPLMAECVLVATGALNNVTGEMNLIALKGLIEKESTLTAAQKVTAVSSLESCIASTMPMVPAPVSSDANRIAAIEAMIKKYGVNNEPCRLMACVTKALITNGCAATAIE